MKNKQFLIEDYSKQDLFNFMDQADDALDQLKDSLTGVQTAAEDIGADEVVYEAKRIADVVDDEVGPEMYGLYKKVSKDEWDKMDEVLDEGLDKATPYMLRKDGSLLKCGLVHPYIISHISDDLKKSLNDLLNEDSNQYKRPNSLEWFYDNMDDEQLKEEIKIFLHSLEFLGYKVPEGININYKEANHVSSEGELFDLYKELNHITNQEFCRVRTSNSRFGGDSDEIYFRISSVGFNWFDLIWKLVTENKNNISDVTIMKDQATFGGGPSYYKHEGKTFDHIDVEDFINISGTPLLESMKFKAELNRLAYNDLVEGKNLMEAYANLHPRYLNAYYEDMKNGYVGKYFTESLGAEKDKIFMLIKELNPNAKEQNYINLSVNQMLAILTKLRNKRKALLGEEVLTEKPDIFGIETDNEIEDEADSRRKAAYQKRRQIIDGDILSYAHNYSMLDKVAEIDNIPGRREFLIKYITAAVTKDRKDDGKGFNRRFASDPEYYGKPIDPAMVEKMADYILDKYKNTYNFKRNLKTTDEALNIKKSDATIWSTIKSSIELAGDDVEDQADNVMDNLHRLEKSHNENFELREDNDINAAMELMIDNNEYKDAPYVGCFWYYPQNEECYGVYSVLASDVPFQDSTLFGKKVKTGRKLHKDIWKKEQFKHKDPRFNGDHTQKPRGRVFEIEDEGFKVMVGDWIDNYPEAKEEIIKEFQLPENTEFIKDEHWDLGHGFSDEFLNLNSALEEDTLNEIAYEKAYVIDKCAELGQQFINHFDKIYNETDEKTIKHHGEEMQGWLDQASSYRMKYNNQTPNEKQLYDWFMAVGRLPIDLFDNETEAEVYDDFANELLDTDKDVLAELKKQDLLHESLTEDVDDLVVEKDVIESDTCPVCGHFLADDGHCPMCEK